MKTVFLSVAFVLGTIAVAGADYHSCKWDADQKLQNCLRWAAENRVNDASCHSYHRQDIRVCNNLRR